MNLELRERPGEDVETWDVYRVNGEARSHIGVIVGTEMEMSDTWDVHRVDPLAPKCRRYLLTITLLGGIEALRTAETDDPT